MKVYIICYISAQSHILEKSTSKDMGQNAVGQSDYRIFKSTVSLEQHGEIAWFFSMLIQSHENWKLIEKCFGGHNQK